MTGGDLLQRAFELGAGLDAVHLAGLDERADMAPEASALVVTDELRTLRRELQRSDSILDGIMPISA